MTTIQWHDVGATDDFSASEPVQVVVSDHLVAVCRVDEAWYALHDLCSHGHARLSEGFIENGCVECPLHQGLIDLRTGAPRSAPVTEPVRTYPIRVVSGRVEVGIDGTH
ncbi:anthranilate 1,2-dioxygenase ferredoxin subunit AndAb [Paraburkholderia gardini]|uniref:Anthranilate 1,2-dioxygenase ferredoxin subunit n=1 Tax=Paraburkholderia gardini TaxID=2823469 RepID=A0ABM8U6Q3_9BURK|nr:anthranilate 1,2-dioxygenase ferredoxin subunit AndAb [Paraburkholderia gardini]CAG4909541.1 Anthranilate 1,2-dioxygenase ferredoxin subunit [Paraburkholderia gardini]